MDGWTCSAQLATLGAGYATAVKAPFTAQELLHSSENYSQEGVLVKEEISIQQSRRVRSLKDI